MAVAYNGGELLVQAFTDLGVDVVFRTPGSEWAPVWEAFARRQEAGEPAPRYLDLTHETVAVAMATGYGLVTRRVQAVLLHGPPGLLHGAMAVHGALLADVGMVVLSSESTTYGDGSGQDPGGQWYRNLSIVGGTHPIAQPFTKWSNRVGSVPTLYTMVTRAGEIADRQPAGPVYLNVPLEVLLEPAEPPLDPRPVVSRGRRVSAADDVEAVARLAATADRPVIITETAGREPGGFEALRDFAEALGIGVIEPASAVCANFAKDSELYLGSDIDPFVDEADLILLVNCRAPYYPPSRRPAKAKTVVIDEVPQRPHIVYQVLNADHYLEGALPETLAQLRKATLAAGDAETFRTRGGTFADAHAAWQKKTDAAERAAAETAGIDPVFLATKLREVVRAEEAVVVDETITHSRIVQRHVGWNRPDCYFSVQGGLGQGIAVALGVKLAVQEGFVILTIGDGAFLYNPIVQSLLAANDFGLPILIVIFNNRKYLSSQPDLSAFASPFDMYAAEVGDAQALDVVLTEAVAAVRSGTSAVLNVAVTT